MDKRANATIGDVTSVVTKGTTPTTLGRNFTAHGIGFIKAECITNDGALIKEKQVYIDEETDRLLKRSKLQKDDVLFSIAGVIGRTALVQANALPANTNQAIAILRPDTTRIIPKFLYYTVRSKDFQDHSLGHVVQTAQANVSLGVLSAAPIWLPSLPVQQHIADTLSAYDELIENSQRRIRILESMARALYREWFVHFRFPGHEDHPRVSSPLGEIPFRWEVKPCSALASYVNGYPFKPAQLGTEGRPIIKIKELKAGIVADTPRNPGDGIPDKFVVQDGHVLFSWSAHLDAYLWMGGEGWLNQHLFNVLPNEGISRDFLFHALKESMPRFRSLSLGATMHHIKRSALDQVFTLLPPETLRKHFDNLVEPMHRQLINLTKRVENLRYTRDLLLPRMLSGQLSLQ